MEYHTLKGTVRYDGTDFAGWQMQSNAPTVQGAIEGEMARIAGVRVPVEGAGRTDSGVHALGQVFSCRWPGPVPARLRHALSKMLAPRIRITELAEVPPSFSARFSARSKRYAYTIDLSREPDPLAARYAWHVPYCMDMRLLAALTPALGGTHDFKSFQSAGTRMESTVRTIFEARLFRDGILGPRDNSNLWRFEFHGNGFLYKMIRNITGTLIEIGRGKLPPEHLEEMLGNPGTFRGICAPAHGLTMMRVYYGGGEKKIAPQPSDCGATKEVSYRDA